VQTLESRLLRRMRGASTLGFRPGRKVGRGSSRVFDRVLWLVPHVL
jgi:hypothetical protein